MDPLQGLQTSLELGRTRGYIQTRTEGDISHLDCRRSESGVWSEPTGELEARIEEKKDSDWSPKLKNSEQI